MEQQRKQLILVTNSFPCIPGDAQFVETEFRELSKFFTCTVVYMFDPGKGRLPLPESVRTVHFPMESRVWTSVKCLLHPAFWAEVKRAARGASPGTLLRRIKGILSYEEKAARFAGFLRKEILRPDMEGVYYTYWKTEPALAFARIRKSYPGLSMITRVHGCDYQTEQVPQWGWWQPFVGTIDRALDRLYFTCDAAKAYYCRTYGYAQEDERYRIARMGAAAQRERSCPARNRLVLVSCSSLIPLKRVERIIEALALLPEGVPVEWRHIGDGPERERLEALAREKLSGRADIRYFFEGWVEHEAVCGLVRTRHGELMITTSESEGLPVSIQEMFSMGIPAIATPVGGIMEVVIDGETGYLLPPDGSAEAARDAILRYWRLSPEEKRAMSDRAYALWKNRYDAAGNAGAFREQLQLLCGEEP